MATRIRTWRPDDLPAVVAYWNRVFAGCRNFYPIEAADFEERVVGNPDGFDPADLFLAIEKDEVVGLGHASPLASGEGRIAFLHVEAPRRGRGIGERLLASCRRRLAGCRPVTLDSQCFSPWYGNVQGPFPPFWGTPEGPTLPADDLASIRFFERRGWQPRFEAVSMEVRPVASDPLSPAGEGTTFHLLDRACPELGGPLEERVRYGRTGEYLTWAAEADGRVVGTVIALSLARAAAHKWGIYELRVLESARGRGIGAGLLERLFATLAGRSVDRLEVLTMPVLSPGAFRLYGRFGFDVVARWAIF